MAYDTSMYGVGLWKAIMNICGDFAYLIRFLVGDEMRVAFGRRSGVKRGRVGIYSLTHMPLIQLRKWRMRILSVLTSGLQY